MSETFSRTKTRRAARSWRAFGMSATDNAQRQRRAESETRRQTACHSPSRTSSTKLSKQKHAQSPKVITKICSSRLDVADWSILSITNLFILELSDTRERLSQVEDELKRSRSEIQYYTEQISHSTGDCRLSLPTELWCSQIKTQNPFSSRESTVKSSSLPDQMPLVTKVCTA